MSIKKQGDFSELSLLYTIQLFKCFADIPVKADRLHGDLFGAKRFAVIQASVGCLIIRQRHLPEGIFDDDGRIAADAEFQIENAVVLVLFEEVGIRRRSSVLALVLDKAVVRAKIHHNIAAVVGTLGD